MEASCSAIIGLKTAHIICGEIFKIVMIYVVALYDNCPSAYYLKVIVKIIRVCLAVDVLLASL